MYRRLVDAADSLLTGRLYRIRPKLPGMPNVKAVYVRPNDLAATVSAFWNGTPTPAPVVSVPTRRPPRLPSGVRDLAAAVVAPNLSVTEYAAAVRRLEGRFVEPLMTDWAVLRPLEKSGPTKKFHTDCTHKSRGGPKFSSSLPVLWFPRPKDRTVLPTRRPDGTDRNVCGRRI